jgi:hypothetical protein
MSELSAYEQARANGKVALTEQHENMCELMIYGTDSARAKRLGVPLNEPLKLEQAADALDIRRRNARQIFEAPGFRALYARKLGELRDSGRARAEHRRTKIVDEEGQGTAADRSVQLKAANAILDDEGKG